MRDTLLNVRQHSRYEYPKIDSRIHYVRFAIAICVCALRGDFIFALAPVMVGCYIRNRGTPKLPSVNYAHPVQLAVC